MPPPCQQAHNDQNRKAHVFLSHTHTHGHPLAIVPFWGWSKTQWRDIGSHRKRLPSDGRQVHRAAVLSTVGKVRFGGSEKYLIKTTPPCVVERLQRLKPSASLRNSVPPTIRGFGSRRRSRKNACFLLDERVWGLARVASQSVRGGVRSYRGSSPVRCDFPETKSLPRSGLLRCRSALLSD